MNGALRRAFVTAFVGVFGLLAAGPAAAHVGGQAAASGAAHTAVTTTCLGSTAPIFDNTNIYAVFNGGIPPVFTTSGKAYCVDSIFAYHWNDGLGDPGPGTIGIRDYGTATLVGSWPVVVQPATGSVLANWIATPSPTPVVINGIYTCESSNPGTWSQNATSGGAGFCRVDGRRADQAAPTVVITSPPGGSDLSGTITVTADASDDVAVDHVTFEYYDATAGTYTPLGTDYTSPYSAVFDTTTVPNRPHNASTIYAQAFDTAGNSSIKYGVGVGINNVTHPTVTLTAPVGGTAIHGTVQLSATASDTSGISRVDYILSRPGFDSTVIGTSTSAPYTAAWDTTPLPDGDVSIAAVAYANSGGSTSTSGTRVTVDNTAPLASLTAPLDGAVLSGVFMLAGTASDPPAGTSSGVAGWTFESRPHGGMSWSVISSGVGAGNVSTTWSTEGSGVYDLRLKVSDTAGNVTSSNIVTITLDNSNPGGVFRIDAPSIPSLDPMSITGGPTAQQIYYATCAKLINAPDTPGQASLENLVAEAADAMPTISADRKTYTFNIRSGLKFSDGTAVTSGSFVRAFERALAPANNDISAGTLFFDIAGAALYNSGLASTISGLIADGPYFAIHLTRPDEAFLAKLASPAACAVPASTPLGRQLNGLPSAGPYYIASYVPGQELILDRNPNYHGTRPSFFDRFVYALGKSPTAAKNDVVENVADYAAGAFNALPTADLASLESAYGGDARPTRFFRAPMMGLRYLVFNTKRSAFLRADVRHAVAGSLDRDTLSFALPNAGSPTDQLIPPGSPGFTDWSIYPLFVTDLTAAKTLIHAAGADASPINLYALSAPQMDAQVEAVRARLVQLGFTVNVVREPAGLLYNDILNPDLPVDVSLISWLADYPDPNDFINVLMDPSFGIDFSHFDLAAELVRMQSTDSIPAGASRYAEYRKLDLELSRDFAPMTAYATYDSVDFFSTRVGCHTFNPYFGMDLAALCIAPLYTPSVTFSANTNSVPAGAAIVPKNAIPVSALTGATTPTTKSAPIDQIPIDQIPIDHIDLASSPIDQIPIDHIGFTAANLMANALGGVPLTQIPLTPPATWETKLATTVLANVPIQTLTLADVVRSAPAVLGTMYLHDISIASSPIDHISLSSIALGTLPIDQIPIDHIGVTIDAAWCTLIHGIPGFADYDCTQIPTQTLMGITLQGVPIDQIPIDHIPIDQINLAGSPIDHIPIDQIDLTGTKIGNVPIDHINLAKSPIDHISLDALPTPNDVVRCDAFVCPGHTLGDAAVANMLRTGATLAMLKKYPGVDLGNIGKGMPPEMTLEDLFALLLGKPAYDFNTLPVSFPLADFASSGGIVHYSAPFRLTGHGAPATVTLTATLTNGERYAAGTSAVSSDGGPLPVGEPVATLSGDVETVKWKVSGVVVGSFYTLTFDAHSGLILASGTAKIDLTVGKDSASAPPLPLVVGDTLEPNNTAAEAKPVAPGALVNSYITSSSDKDFYSVAMPPAGTLVTINLNRLPADYDLVLYGPPTEPLRSAPIDHISIDQLPAGEPAPTLQQRSQEITTEPLQDVPTNLSPGQVVLGTSNARGTAPEEITFVSNGQPGNLTIQVTGFNGVSSPLPYLLQVDETPPPALPPCQPRAMGSGGVAGTMPNIAGNVNTLFLVNQMQLGDIYGAPAAANVMSALNTTVANGSGGVIGAVVPVESDPAVAAGYAAWNANPCSPALANNIVRSIGTLLDTISSGRPIQNIVVIGSDEIVPMARLNDATVIANESEYASTLGYATNNEYISALVNHTLLSDDPYGAKFNGQAYVPSIGLSRVVETPAEIVAQFDQYNSVGGLLNPTTAFWAGYDFLSDGTAAAAQASRSQGKVVTELNNDTWTLTQLLGEMFPAVSPPALMGVNAHSDQYRQLPADQNAARRQDVLYTTADLASLGPAATLRRNVLTIGCHTGYSAADTIFGAGNPLARDWAQTYARAGAATYTANTGYGLGDTVSVAYSEQLQVFLSKRLNGSLNVGRATSFSKQDYYGSLATFTGYDAKAMAESTTYGIGLYRVGTLPAPAPPSPPATFVDGPTGLTAASFDFSPTFHRNDTPFGSFFDIGGNIVAESRRPIEPMVSANASMPNMIAHDALITSLGNVTEVAPFDAAFSRPVVDSKKAEPELVGLTTYPTQLATVRTIDTPTGREQRLVFVPAQFRSDGGPDPRGMGRQVLYGSSSVRVFYSDSPDHTKPSLGPVTLARVGTSLVGFSVDVSGTSAIKRVLVVYRDGGTSRSLDLGCINGHCSGAGPLTDSSTSYMVQAVDANGNVGTTMDKGLVPAPTVQTTSGGVTPSVSGPKTGDWYTGAAGVTFTAPAGVTVTYSLDGSIAATYTGATIAVSGDGVHMLAYEAPDGSRGNLVIPIDTLPPTIVTTDRSYLLGSTGNQFDVSCIDPGSGVAVCSTTPAEPDTSSIGAKSFSVHAEDRVGHTADAVGQYHVFWPFRGFLGLGNPPIVNRRTAGKTVRLRFSLGGDRGLSIIEPGYPKVTPLACTAPTVGPEQDDNNNDNNGDNNGDNNNEGRPSSGSRIDYIPRLDQYVYFWKTDRAWRGTCKQIDLGLVDGSHHVAFFSFVTGD